MTKVMMMDDDAIDDFIAELNVLKIKLVFSVNSVEIFICILLFLFYSENSLGRCAPNK